MNRTTAVRLSIALMLLSALAPRGAQTLGTLYAFNSYVKSGDGTDPTATDGPVFEIFGFVLRPASADGSLEILNARSINSGPKRA
jgi:hypothetical protein